MFPTLTDQVRMLDAAFRSLTVMGASGHSTAYGLLLQRLLRRFSARGAMSEVVMPGPDTGTATGWFHRQNAQRVFDSARLHLLARRINRKRLGVKLTQLRQRDTASARRLRHMHSSATTASVDSTEAGEGAGNATPAVAPATPKAGAVLANASIKSPTNGTEDGTDAALSPSGKTRRMSLSFEFHEGARLDDGLAGSSDGLQYVCWAHRAMNCGVEVVRLPSLTPNLLFCKRAGLQRRTSR